MALIASYARKPIPEHHLYLGEVDLFRKVLAAPVEILQSLTDAIDQGDIPTPISLFVPPVAVSSLPKSSNAIKIVSCPSLEEAIYQTWPDLR